MNDRLHTANTNAPVTTGAHKVKHILLFASLLATLALAAAYFPPKFQPDETEDTSRSAVQEQNRIAFTLALFTFYDEHCERLSKSAQENVAILTTMADKKLLAANKQIINKWRLVRGNPAVCRDVLDMPSFLNAVSQ